MTHTPTPRASGHRARTMQLTRAAPWSSRVRAGRQRRLAEIRAVRAAYDDSLALLSHELRGPIHVILGWSNLLRQGDLSHEMCDRGLQVIERQARAQSELV